ncbi:MULTISPECIES: redoxin domain-containing protein [Paenibacillus]|jgi:peroxiredoxin|uniref:Alkyl hydroperoxide reductase/ Thiol specific antioxidant/ Mal allergen n=2 Tax=Paenibacillus lactis TaxID=228574 RepID=G4HF55_9BACL|nr:redoxin domain-containing protein [Paenibacillus lactis]EHB64372.1 alkyl hydroperoxide reductase/ Thiol specific antioxidant/ Mal allergen [Paenibacillus lactis 154]MBP1892932.1 peroxiredoxin [Paenibacillus lactis]MCM3495245.1 redoxin domain-containing protein [Paenibacillus lactis]GIO91872.1 thiol-disulfide oxidoreductase ResA [Paenibacillus lactis]HAF97594.1 alkyl hydroperoxide reductase [Paenibacillus lactis]
MGKSKKSIQIVILLAIVLIGVYAVATVVFGSDEVPKVGEKAANFELLGMDGNVHTMSEYEGKARVINFWGTYCPPCVREMPALQAQWEKWKDQGVEIVGINVGENKMTVENFVAQTGVKFPILMDPDRDAVASYGVGPMPTTFFVTASGKIHHIRIGELDLDTLDKQIEQLVKAK